VQKQSFFIEDYVASAIFSEPAKMMFVSLGGLALFNKRKAKNN